MLPETTRTRIEQDATAHMHTYVKGMIGDDEFMPSNLKWSYIAGATAEAERSAGTWVKASEMNHEEFIAYYARLDHDTEAEIKSSGYFKDDFFFFHMHNLKINKDQFSVLEILDESQSLDNKDREIAFHKWVTENEYEINNRAQITHSIEQFHEIWEQSLTNKP